MRCAHICVTAPATSARPTGGVTARRCSYRCLPEPRRGSCSWSGGVASAAAAAGGVACRTAVSCAATGSPSAVELRTADRPLVNSPIVVLTAPRNGGPLSRAATVVTDAAGRFSFATGVGPSRTVRFDYGGTRVTRPALAEVRVLVRARSSIAVDRRFALNGQAVRFRGRLAAGPDSRRRQADRPPGLLPRAVAHVRDAPHGSARPLVLRLPLRGHQRASSRTASGPASGARRPIPMSSAARGSCA